VQKLSAFTVLYAEDENGIRNNICEILKHLFKETYTAKNSSEAYKLYLEKKPDLIITDIKMSAGETGIELIKRIRKLDHKTRVIITSAHTDLEYMLDVAELHLVKYIIKPITNEKLIDALESFLKTHGDDKVYHIKKDCLFDSSKSMIISEKKETPLTKKEAIFLKLLITKNRIITYEEMENIIWNDGSVMTANAMRLFIKNFRKKLPENLLKNIQGTGYRLIIE
jgi:DNA-binding response OmpR family regulator